MNVHDQSPSAEPTCRAGAHDAGKCAAGQGRSLLGPAALFVPCHCVARSDGSLGGFRYGLAVKESLLEREAEGGRGPDGRAGG
ncbi:MGMT family protein [Actinomyces slackii]|uniref:MGMT family protein n=1 Tax=Actinomyces slackii TaxID=52774 RepID=UPI0022B29D78|nr:MGMT family protein [Actinomyces slackii]